MSRVRGATMAPTGKRSLEWTILELLEARGEGKTICPSEVARQVAGSESRSRWEPLMEPVREAARALVAAGEIDVTQHGEAVEMDAVKGPIRLRRRANVHS